MNAGSYGVYVDIEKYINSNLLVKNNIYFLPALHGRLEFGIAAWVLMKNIDFGAVALELPDFMKRAYLEGVRRLPYISAVCVEAPERLYYHLIEPQDAMCEAVRAFLPSRENGVHFVDRFIDDYRGGSDSFPDSYALYGAGLVDYCSNYYKISNKTSLNERPHEDLQREQFMAANLQFISKKYDKILFVCGMYHYPAIFDMLDYNNAIPFYNRGVKRVYLANLAAASHESVMSEPAFIIERFENARALSRNDFEGLLKNSADEKKCESINESDINKISGDILNQKNIISFDFISLRRKDPDNSGVFSVKASDEDERLRNEVSGALHDAQYELKIKSVEDKFACLSPQALDRAKLNFEILELAAVNYHKNIGAVVGLNYFNIMLKFLYNYVKIKGGLAAGIYDLLMAARAACDDNYAYEVFEKACSYNRIDRSNKYPTLSLTLEDLKIDGRRIRFHRRLKSVKQLFAPYLKKRKKEEKPGDWLREWKNNEDTICSYQPEDIIIENFGLLLRKKSRRALNDEKSRVEPFCTSLMDGVDMRETIRNYHLNKSIFVKVSMRGQGAADTVVMIFDEDIVAGGVTGVEKYPYKMTWLGEHGQESDMAFYSSIPGEKIVGPGISRCEYGGFMLSYPPLRLYDVWRDPAYFAAKNKPETLLLAALDYSLEKNVVYCAKKPPRTFFKSIAARLGRKIIYVPIGQFSRITIEKLRVMHILSNKKIRDIARDYIW